jgi:hypothetical protein
MPSKFPPFEAELHASGHTLIPHLLSADLKAPNLGRTERLPPLKRNIQEEIPRQNHAWAIGVAFNTAARAMLGASE